LEKWRRKKIVETFFSFFSSNIFSRSVDFLSSNQTSYLSYMSSETNQDKLMNEENMNFLNNSNYQFQNSTNTTPNHNASFRSTVSSSLRLSASATYPSYADQQPTSFSSSPRHEQRRFNSSSSVSSVLPNLQEPSFLIPVMPDIIKVREPLPLNRNPPVKGYDMKTLRAQLSFLQEEMNEKNENYNEICYQNEQLWSYISQLLEANKTNILKMKEYTSSLTKELQIIYKERLEYAEKLEMARSSQQMLLDLNSELQESLITKEEYDKRKKSAMEEYRKAKEEKKELEESLKEKLLQCENYENLLVAYRSSKQEEELSEKADDFFYSNKIILKAAYSRFRKGVKKRLREQQLINLCVSIKNRFMKTIILTQWKRYQQIAVFTKAHRIIREKESLLLFFTKWKVFKALETLFHRSKRRFLLSHCFHNWIVYLKEERVNRFYERKRIEHIDKQIKKKCFASWKSSIVFLNWYDKTTQEKELQARTFYKKKVFFGWKNTTFSTLLTLQKQFQQCSLIKEKIYFFNWFQLCRRIWKVRGTLLRRFFRNLRSNLGNKVLSTKKRRYALQYYIVRLKKNAFRRYSTWIQHKKNQRQRYKKKTSKYLSVFISRLLKQSFLHWRYASTILYRQQLSLEFAIETYQENRLTESWKKWFLKNQQIKRNKTLYRQFFGNRLLKGFIQYNSIAKYQKQLRLKDSLILKKINKIKQILSLKRWYSLIQKKKKLTFFKFSFSRNLRFTLLIKYWKNWKTIFSKILYYKFKENMIEKNRLLSLSSLYQEQLTTVNEEKQLLLKEKSSTVETIQNLQELVSQKSSLVENQLLLIEQQEKQKLSLSNLVNSLTSQYQELLKEREQWKLLEETYLLERKQETQERERRHRESMNRIEKMANDSLSLKENMKLVTNDLSQQYDHHNKTLSYYSSVLKEKEKDKDHSMSMLKQSELEIKELEDSDLDDDDHEGGKEPFNGLMSVSSSTGSEGSETRRSQKPIGKSLENEIDKVSKKLKEIQNETNNINRDNSKILREKISENRVLREDAGKTFLLLSLCSLLCLLSFSILFFVLIDDRFSTS
jgi:hypothetical protein